ncbi:MAG: hypothetical protein AB7V48_15425 [Sedimentibacter sp.]
MKQKIANLTKEQQQLLNKTESELGCVLVAYETLGQSQNTSK